MTDDQVWLLAYIQILGWTLHPGYLKPGCTPPSTEQVALTADQVVAELRKRYPWQQSQEQ